MIFELKDYQFTSNVLPHNETSSKQHITIKIGIQDFPYEDMVAYRNIVHVFPNELTYDEQKLSAVDYMNTWISQNYPNI